MLIIYAVLFVCAIKALVQDRIVHLLELRDVGYECSCPETPLLCPRAALGVVESSAQATPQNWKCIEVY
jgi:hypothetical protein